MASAMVAMASLDRMFDFIEMHGGDREEIKRQFGIGSVTQLFQNRPQLAACDNNNACLLVVAGIDFITLQLQKASRAINDDNIDALVTSTARLESSLEYSLAMKLAATMKKSEATIIDEDATMESAALENSFEYSLALGAEERISIHHPQEQDNATSSTTNSRISTKGNDKKPKEVAFTRLGEDIDNDDDFDIEFLKQLEFDQDCPWELDLESNEVFLKRSPEKSRIPLSLYIMLYDYQRVGVAWILDLFVNDTGGIVGDDPGMGKTIQTLAALFCLMKNGAIRNALVVSSKSNMETTWIKQANDIASHFSWGRNKPYILSIGPGLTTSSRETALRKARSCSEDQPHLVIASYPHVVKSGFYGIKRCNAFDYVVLDEAHKAKNQSTNTRKSIDKISRYASKLLLTATPLLNNELELFSLVDFATDSKVLPTEKKFKERYQKPIEKGSKPNASDHERQTGDNRVVELRELISPHLLRRRKKDDGNTWQFDVWTRLSSSQRELYAEFVKSLSLRDAVAMGKNHQCWALPAIRRIRDLCNHPLVFTYGAELRNENMQELGKEELISQSRKLTLLIDLLRKWRQDGFKALVFSESIPMLNIIQYVLSDIPGITACRIDGSTTQKKRKDLVEDFNLPGSSRNVMLLSTRAASEGLDLYGANKAVLFDPPWGEATAVQAGGRINRPQQKLETEFIQLVTAGTVEEKMLSKQIYKGGLERTLLGGIGLGIGRGAGIRSYFKKRLFDKDELTKLFTLGPDGACECLDLFNQPQDATWTEKCSTGKGQSKDVIGISLRKKVYEDKAKEGDESKDGNEKEDEDENSKNPPALENNDMDVDENGGENENRELSGSTSMDMEVDANGDESENNKNPRALENDGILEKMMSALENNDMEE